ncbi:MAG: T9SS type A sorting domain-containing protein [Bacteroidia bacterium]
MKLPLQIGNLKSILLIAQLMLYGFAFSQTDPVSTIPQNTFSSPTKIFSSKKTENENSDIFGTDTHFVENIGEYGDTVNSFGRMGKIKYGYEGFLMPVLFTNKGLIYLQRKVKMPSEEEKEGMIKRGMTPEQIAAKNKITDRTITMEWLKANPNVEVIAEDVCESYNTYGMVPDKAQTFKKIVYKELYPGIDVEYYFTSNSKKGFEYNIIVKPGADVSVIKMQYGGDVKSLRTDRSGNLLAKSSLGTMTETLPLSFYSDEKENRMVTSFSVIKNTVSFSTPLNYDKNRTLIIDPFVTGTANLTGPNAGKAKDVDFDYAGNVYVTGGGDLNSHKLAKYNSAGVLQWTYSGVQAVPSWNFGPYYGGWVVEKTTGNIYLGQGFNFTTGFIIVRINTTGLYDNYITTGNPNFRENWKMYWSCNSGSPQIIIAGGGTNSNINLGICSPPSTVLSAINITNIPAIAFQDMADMVIDQVTNSMYTIYASGSVPALNNSIYKNNSPYSSASIAWNVPSGYTPLQEANNRPYLSISLVDNSTNILAINSSYLFYWDGKNLKAFNKTTGGLVGTPLTIATNTNLMQGGIIADACNNIFVGSTNGTIKVYNFNGSVFDDAAQPDISIPGFTTNSVYDLAYNETQKILYASGNGFVSSFDVSSYGCANTSFALTVNPNCATASASTVISPAPPVGSTVTYVLYVGATQIASNTTGTFTALSPNTNYTIVATVNMSCSGVQTTTNFTLPGPILNAVKTDANCGSNNGTITAAGSGGVAPYTYSLDGVTFVSSGTFTSLAGGLYTVTVKDVNGCKTTTLMNILNTNGPVVSFTQTDATCGSSTGTITVTAATLNPPLQYSLNGTTYQSSNFFTGLLPGNYTLTVKDTTGCTNVVSVTINSGPASTLTAIPASATCGQANGTITAFGSGGTAPLQYSINGNNFQSSNVFTGVSPGVYTVTMLDANGCVKTANVTVTNTGGPSVTATSTSAACSNTNGSITANGTAGVAPLQYSINGTTFQNSNVFTGLAAGAYTVTVKDANGCINTVNITVNSTTGPSVTAVAVASSCASNSGSITATGTGGVAPLTYSLNGVTFQSSTLFTALAAGSYVVLVKDLSGCINAFPITVPNSTAPSITVASTPASCNLNDGIITSTGLGGTAPLQYSINGTTFQASNIFSGLAIGTYTVTVKDVNGCTSSASIGVSSVTGLTLAVGTISSNCTISNGGSITATATGNNPPLQYSINGTTYQASNVFTGLSAGNYTVYVKDALGCILSKSATISSAFAPVVVATATNSSCNSNTGTITASGSGGTGALLYSINGTTFQSNTFFNNVSPGTYTVTVQDASGCTATTVVTIINVGAGPGISTFTVVVKGTYPCNGSLGKITNPKVNGATCNSCTYSLNGAPFIPNSTQLYLNLSAGNYTVTAMDANGCTKAISVTLGVAANSTATAVVTASPCGANSGSITITGIGPNTPYHASITGLAGPWFNFNTTKTFSGLAPGTYTITMADDESFDPGPPLDPGGCITTLTVIVPSIGGPALALSKTDGTCNLSNGTITATGSGGTAPLTYSIDGITFQSSGIFTGLAAGTYTVSVMDATGCINSSTITISSPGVPSVTTATTGSTCSSNNGIITAFGNGGVAPLTYSVNGILFQTGNAFSNLAPGNYTVYVKDVNGCYSTISATVANTPRPQISAYSVPASCNNNNGSLVAIGTGIYTPLQFSIDGITFQSNNVFTGLAAGAYTVTVMDATGCTNTTGITLGNLGGPLLTATATATTCNGTNGTITATGSGGSGTLQYSINGINFQTSNIFTGVAAGTYTVTVNDANGCLNTKTILVGNVIGPQVLNATVVNSKCGNSNGSITAAGSGGVAPLQYSINGTTFQASTLFTLLPAATYTVTVRDANACTKTLNVIVQNLAGPALSTTATNASCYKNDGTITALATGGSVLLTYSKNGITYQASNVFTNLAIGTYTITVKDANSCLSTSTATVSPLAPPSVTATISSFPCGATITVVASGVSQFLYSLDSVTWQSSNIFTCIAPGTYSIYVKDANGCISKIVMALGIPLPISVINFDAFKNNNVVDLKWTTATEINNDYFTIEKSKDGIHFASITTVDGAGNSSTTLNYATTDEQPYSGINYYRLKQTDFNGMFTYSKTVSVNFKNDNALFIFPNPVDNDMFIYTGQIINQISIIDVTGRAVGQWTGDFTNKIKLDLSGIAAGCYSLKTLNNMGEEKLQVFIKH